MARRTRTRSLRWLARAATTTVVAIAMVASGASAAQAASSYPTLGTANVRYGASTASAIMTTLPQGAQVSIDCYVTGQNVSGTTIWDHRTAGGYVSDSLLLTGADSAVVPLCGPAAQQATPIVARFRDRIAAGWADRNYAFPQGPKIIWDDDCTDFISTALVRSGMRATASWTASTTDKSQQASPTYGDPSPTLAFVQANAFVNYMVSTGNATETPIVWSDNTASHAAIGDVIAYDWDGDGTFDHLSIVVSLNRSGYPTVAQESPSVIRYWSWSTTASSWIQQANPNATAWLIHFVK